MAASVDCRARQENRNFDSCTLSNGTVSNAPCLVANSNGSLLLAARKGDDLQYVGSVGTGFKEKVAIELRETLDKLVSRKPPVSYGGRRKNAVWAQPTLIAEIEYRAWTDDGKLRHASFKGLREVQDNAAVYEIYD
ncbi:hypothetical protein FE844_032065 (plasmid) [Rhizobium indicum]|nr:hypothetical protein FE844_032065 [Rhizobium indicum]